MGAGGSGTAGGGGGGYSPGGASGGLNNFGNYGGAVDTGYSGLGRRDTSAPGGTTSANTPEVRTYKDAQGNTVKVYQQPNAGRMTAVGYKEVYSPSGHLISSTKPQSSANTPQTNTRLTNDRQAR